MMRVFRYCILAAALAGCFLSESDEAGVSFRFTDYSQVKREMIRLTFTDGKRTWKLDGSDFESDHSGSPSIGKTRTFKTATAGELKVRFKLLDGEKLISSGQFEMPLRSDWAWDIDFQSSPARRDPLDGCFGCFGAKVFALTEGYGMLPSDSLYVIWGGNSIKNPVVY